MGERDGHGVCVSESDEQRSSEPDPVVGDNAESVSHCVTVAHEVTVLWAPPPWDRLLPLVNTYIATSSGSPVPRGSAS